jgi:hypothetical protein
MNGTAVHVHYNVIPIAFKLVYHLNFPFRTQSASSEKSLLALFFSFLPLSLSGVLTALVAYRTGSLAGRLAGCLALTTAALLHGLLQISGYQGLNVLHIVHSPYLFISVPYLPD